MHKKGIVALFFAAYFFLYAISPLTYSLHGNQASASGLEPQRPAFSFRSLHVVVWEFLVQEITSRSEARQEENEGTILIRKKRALLPEDDTLRLNPHASVIHTSVAVAPAVDTLSQRSPFAAPLSAHTGFNSLYSGHSPPVS